MNTDPRAPIRKRRLVKWAKAHGVDIPAGLRVNTPYVGHAARRLIRDVQRKAFLGAHTTGTFDEKTLDLIRPAITHGARALRVARREIGVTENPPGSNSGARVRDYQDATHAYNAPWCASFVTWCFGEVGIHLQGFNTAYCPSWMATARAQRNGLRLVNHPSTSLRPGDVALFDWQGDGTPDHIEFVEKPLDKYGNFVTIGGNTTFETNADQSAAANSNGGAVARRHRNAKDVSCFIRVGA